MFVRVYARASTDHQTLSTEGQIALCKDAFDSFKRLRPKWAEAQWGGAFADGAEDHACRDSVFRERHNGSLILAASQPGDVILVSNYDRIFASVVDVCETLELLRERQVGLLILDADLDTTTIVGEFCFKILALVKEMEVREIRRRTRESIAYRKKIGRPYNRPSVGWRHVLLHVPGVSGPQRYPVPDNADRRRAREILNVMQSRQLDWEQARQFCNAMGLKQKNGRPWTKNTFRVWCCAAKRDFPLPNGSHTAAPIPANAKPVVIETIPEAD